MRNMKTMIGEEFLCTMKKMMSVDKKDFCQKLFSISLVPGSSTRKNSFSPRGATKRKWDKKSFMYYLCHVFMIWCFYYTQTKHCE